MLLKKIGGVTAEEGRDNMKHGLSHSTKIKTCRTTKNSSDSGISL